jgi:ubiquinone/menaquinone biosynthesis C-methylase UbiE
MSQDPFYKFHWKEIDEERMAAYRTMFKWSDDAEQLYAPTGIRGGQTVADFGCGPGYTAVEFAKRVGAEGRVHALDINADFLAQMRENAELAGFADRISPHQCDGSALPLADAGLDCISARNAIMYVDDPVQTFREFYRVLKPGGIVHAIEGDRFMMVMEPVPHDLWRSFVKAAAHACRTADMGRKLYLAASEAGFETVNLQVIANADTCGRLLPMVTNMAKYARLSGVMRDEDIDQVVEIVQQALQDGVYLAVSPQFVVVGTRPTDT